MVVLPGALRPAPWWRPWWDLGGLPRRCPAALDVAWGNLFRPLDRPSKSCSSLRAGLTLTSATARRHGGPPTMTQVLSNSHKASQNMIVLMVALQTAGKIIASKVRMNHFVMTVSPYQQSSCSPVSYKCDIDDCRKDPL